MPTNRARQVGPIEINRAWGELARQSIASARFADCKLTSGQIVNLARDRGQVFRVSAVLDAMFLDKTSQPSPLSQSRGFWRLAYFAPIEADPDELLQAAVEIIAKFFEVVKPAGIYWYAVEGSTWPLDDLLRRIGREWFEGNERARSEMRAAAQVWELV